METPTTFKFRATRVHTPASDATQLMWPKQGMDGLRTRRPRPGCAQHSGRRRFAPYRCISDATIHHTVSFIRPRGMVMQERPHLK